MQDAILDLWEVYRGHSLRFRLWPACPASLVGPACWWSIGIATFTELTGENPPFPCSKCCLEKACYVWIYTGRDRGLETARKHEAMTTGRWIRRDLLPQFLERVRWELVRISVAQRRQLQATQTGVVDWSGPDMGPGVKRYWTTRVCEYP